MHYAHTEQITVLCFVRGSIKYVFCSIRALFTSQLSHIIKSRPYIQTLMSILPSGLTGRSFQKFRTHCLVSSPKHTVPSKVVVVIVMVMVIVIIIVIIIEAIEAM